jgi:hypothetical protein
MTIFILFLLERRIDVSKRNLKTRASKIDWATVDAAPVFVRFFIPPTVVLAEINPNREYSMKKSRTTLTDLLLMIFTEPPSMQRGR